jgi:uncharacterized protein (TIGR03086 family)
MVASPAGVALLERAVGYMLGSLRLVTADSLALPTPCRQWNVGALLNHLAASLSTLIVAVEPARTPVTGVGEDGASLVRVLASHLVGAWTGPPMTGLRASGGRGCDALNDRLLSGAGVLTHGLVSGAGAIEVAVHGWDIARARGVSNPIPPSLADELLDLAVVLVTDAERPALFAPPVPISSRAEMSNRLVAYLGRDPS